MGLALLIDECILAERGIMDTTTVNLRAAKCIHHWDLGGPHSGIVHAVCRKCGAEQDYPSSPDVQNNRYRSPVRPRKPT